MARSSFILKLPSVDPRQIPSVSVPLSHQSHWGERSTWLPRQFSTFCCGRHVSGAVFCPSRDNYPLDFIKVLLYNCWIDE